MIGRQDLIYKTCHNCNGTGNNPNKRKKSCPVCLGSGKVEYCKSCGELMPCSGTLEDTFDQSYCQKEHKKELEAEGYTFCKR